MFLSNYLDRTKFKLLCDTYDSWYIEGFDEENFISIYNIFKKYGFYFIDDIILNYLEIFELDVTDVEEKIIKLREKLGSNFIFIIGNDMRYLEEIFN